ncbi:Clp protease N-terminal domain-containing protein [Streptomyces sp. NPDC047002]|uniref:Clp protease N-terminal domain-containing protein n=1 Tax=Streptomyces sp. NPDC047002 TaxID=3155475 RepID=UPI0034514ACB
MRCPVPRGSGSPGAVPVDLDTRITVELSSVVAGARRRAHRDGDGQLDTAHLLHSLLESDPEVRAVFGDGGQAARVLGYLVQRSIGYGLRWHGTVEDSGAVPRVTPTGRGGWSPAAAAALEHAQARASGDGARPAHGVDLLAGLAADPECRAVEVLARAGVDAEELAGRLAEV